MGAYRWRRFDRTQGGSLYLDESDACLYYMDKTSGRPSDSEPNQLIYNLKISPVDMTDAQRRAGSKDKAIRRCADDIADLLEHWVTVTPENTILVPIPPSKPVGTRGYDNRMTLVCERVQAKTRIRCIDCLSTKTDMGAMHEGDFGRDVERLRQNTAFDPGMIPDGIRNVLLVDDQLTKGTHFKAVKPMFVELGYAVAGVFWAKEHFKGVEYGW